MAKQDALTDARAAILADMALRGATTEAIAATAQVIGYGTGSVGASNATAVQPHVAPSWLAGAIGVLPISPNVKTSEDVKSKAKTTATADGPRQWTGPFAGGKDGSGFSKGGNPMVAVETINRKGGVFSVDIPTDAYLYILGLGAAAERARIEAEATLPKVVKP